MEGGINYMLALIVRMTMEEAVLTVKIQDPFQVRRFGSRKQASTHCWSKSHSLQFVHYRFA